MSQSVYVYDPTVNDPLSKVRGIGRYLQVLKENFSDDWIFTNNIAIKQYNNSIFINPFFNFLKPTLLMTRLAKKQIAVIHDLIPLKYPDHFPAGIKGKLNIFLNKLALKNYDLILTDSEASKKDIVQILNQSPDKVKVVYPCLPKLFLKSLKTVIARSETTKQSGQTRLPRPAFGGTRNDNYILYVGDATWNKNLVNLARAIKIINIPCVFVGRVFSKKKQQLAFKMVGGERRGAPTSRTYKLVSEAGADARQDPPSNNSWTKELNQFLSETKDNKLFIFPGFIPDEKLIQLYRQAKLNILVSRAEGYGFSYFEAASQGCPSVLSNIPVLKETAGDTALFCDPQNPQDIADKISELYFNDNLRNSLGQKAKQRLSQFSPKNFKKTFSSIIS